MLFVLTGGSPENLLKAHLAKVAKKRRLRHAVGVHISDHGKFIELLFGGL